MANNTAEKPKKKRNRCLSCCITAIIVVLVIILAVCAIGLGIADHYLKTNYSVGVGDCFKALHGFNDTNAKNIETDPATSGDNDAFYDELKKTLFLGENVDLESVVLNAIDKLQASEEGEQRLQALESSDGEGENKELFSELTALVGDLYKEGNVDLVRLRKYIEGEADLDADYDSEFVVKFEGNYVVGIINNVLNTMLSKEADTADLVGKVALRQITFGKSGDSSYIKLVARVQLRDIAIGYMDKEDLSQVPSFVVSMAKKAVPVYAYATAKMTLSEEPKLDLTLNNIAPATMKQMYKLVYGVSGTDIERELNNAAAQIVTSLNESAAFVLDMLSEIDESGKIKIDVYGMLADVLNDNLGEEGQPALDLTGPNIAKFLVGVLGSDEENAIKERIELDSRYGEEDWQTKNAAILVENMADSFALAKNYFVNGTDEYGNKIISVENGVITGSDRIIGRVYSDSIGNLYYKRSGAQFKLFVSDDLKVSRYAQSGYNTFYSLDLHYSYDGEDYTLYRSEDESTIVGVCGDKAMNKNGAYTELTTLYVDEDGNVYSSNTKPNLIEITKEQLTSDVIFNILGSENPSMDDILDLLDLSALRVNGIESWKNPITISDIQLVSLLGGMIDDYIGEDIAKANPAISYAALKKEHANDLLTIGLTVETEPLLTGEMAAFLPLIGEKLYLEIEADITLGKAETEYLPVKVRYNDLGDVFTEDLLGTIDKIAGEINLVGELENAARGIRDMLAQLNEKVSLVINDGEVALSSPAELIVGLMSQETQLDADMFVSAVEFLLGSDSKVALAEIKANNPAFADEEWQTKQTNGFVEVFAEAFVLNKERFKATDGVNYSLDKISEIINGDSGFTKEQVIDLLDYDTMKADGVGAWKNSFTVTEAQLAAVIDYFKADSLPGLDAEVVNAEVSVKNGKQYVTLGLAINITGMVGGDALLEKITGMIGEELYASITIEVTSGASEYEAAEIVINDMTVEETRTVLELLESVQSEFNLTEKVSDAETEVRKLLNKLKENVAFELVDGGMSFAAPQETVSGALFDEMPAGMTASEMTDALTALMTSSADEALAEIKANNPAFADEDWQTKSVNSFVEKFTEAFILKKDTFKDGTGYSLAKVTDMMKNGTVSMSELSDMLDYDVMKADGFGAWKTVLAASDAELGAVIDAVKNEYLAAYTSMDVIVEYVYVFNNNGKSYVRLGVSLDTAKLIGEAGDYAAIFDVLGNRTYAQITIDVTQNAATYDSTEVIINDMDASQTDKLLVLVESMSSDFDRKALFEGVAESVRNLFNEIDGNMAIDVENGSLTFGCAQDMIFGMLIEEPKEDMTASDMTDALTALATCADSYSKENNNFVADTSLDADHEAFWNGVLKNKYFISGNIKTLFGSLVVGNDATATLINSIDSSLFTTATGLYAHSSLADQEYMANNDRLSWLFRANSFAMAKLIGNSTFKNIEIYKTEIIDNGGTAQVRMIVVVPTTAVIATMGELGDGSVLILKNILGEKLGVEIGWTNTSEATYSLNGMNEEQTEKLGKLIYNMTGKEIFAADSDIAKAAVTARDSFEKHFNYGLTDGNGAAWMDYFYDVVQSNVFPNAAGKENITSENVYELMKTLYERPITDGRFDSSKAGYTSNAATLSTISPYVQSSQYTAVGAAQTLVISPTNPVAKLTATVRYNIEGLGGYALDILPGDIFITVDYDAHPVVSGLSVSIDNSTIEARFNVATNDASVKKCLLYLGVDVEEAIDMAHAQLDDYIRSNLTF